MLLFADGFDWIDSGNSGSEIADIATMKYVVGSTALDSGNGRGGTGRAIIWTTDVNNSHFTTFSLRDGADPSICIFGAAVKLGSSFVDNRSWFRLDSGGDAQCSIRYETSNDTMRLLRGDSSQVAVSPDLSSDLLTDTWHYIEIKLKIDDSTGFVIMKIDGKVVWESSALLDTKATSDSFYWDRVRIFGSGLSQNSLWDDLYICDDSGSKNNDFLGDIKIETVVPEQDGAQINFNPSTGSEHYSLVDEFPLLSSITETDYTESDTAGDFELFEFPDITDTLNNKDVLGIVVNPLVRLTDGQPREMRGVSRLKNHEQEQTVEMRQDIFTNPFIVYEDDPNGLAWSLRTVNKGQFGIKLQT